MKLFLGIIGCFLAASLTAEASLYRVPAVPVSAEAPTASEARAMALAGGQTDAFWALMRKMVAPQRLEDIPVLSQEQITHLVQDVSIADEKTTPTHYRASISVRFKPKDIQDFLTERRVPFLTQAPPRFVVVPLMRTPAGVWTLEEGNPLYLFLKSGAADSALYRFSVPVGDLTEIKLAQQAVETQNMALLLPLIEMYDAEQVLVVTLELADAIAQFSTATVPADRAQTQDISFRILATEETIGQLLPQAWAKIVSDLEKKWRLAKTNNLETPQIFWAEVPVAHLSEWTQIRRKLEEASFLDGFALRAFRPKQALIEMKYKGAGEQLQERFREVDLFFVPKTKNQIGLLTVIEPSGNPFTLTQEDL